MAPAEPPAGREHESATELTPVLFGTALWAVALELHRADAALDAEVVAQEHDRRGAISPWVVERHSLGVPSGRTKPDSGLEPESGLCALEACRSLHESDPINVAPLMQAIHFAR